jgi:hypothetical protein
MSSVELGSVTGFDLSRQGFGSKAPLVLNKERTCLILEH